MSYLILALAAILYQASPASGLSAGAREAIAIVKACPNWQGDTAKISKAIGKLSSCSNQTLLEVVEILTAQSTPCLPRPEYKRRNDIARGFGIDEFDAQKVLFIDRLLFDYPREAPKDAPCFYFRRKLGATFDMQYPLQFDGSGRLAHVLPVSYYPYPGEAWAGRVPDLLAEFKYFASHFKRKVPVCATRFALLSDSACCINDQASLGERNCQIQARTTPTCSYPPHLSSTQARFSGDY